MTRRDGWAGLALALGAALVWDVWAVRCAHECASTYARRHPAAIGAFWVALACHFWAPGAHRWDPLYQVGARARRRQ